MNSSPTSIRVNLSPPSNYEIIVGQNILDDCGKKIAELVSLQRCVIISDSNVAPLYAKQVQQSLHSAGMKSDQVTVPAGESSKSLSQVEEICRNMIVAGHDRHSFVVALGGGVIGDLAGLVASVFYRGIPLIQIPTTIVSQVDSSIGGKTGVNAPEGKNLIGAFHQPKLVIADTTTLQTLPDREFNEGFAEAIKHAAIRDGDMLEEIMNVKGASNLDSLIAKNVQIKARVVEEDEKEILGTRAHLNYGHTIGHAIEAAGGYGEFLHGEAISLGLICANFISSELFNFSSEQSDRIKTALIKFNLPITLDKEISTDSILKIMRADKKFKNGQIRFVALHELGKPELTDKVTEAMISKSIATIR